MSLGFKKIVMKLCLDGVRVHDLRYIHDLVMLLMRLLTLRLCRKD
jgi:hypothetical protein